MKKQIILIAVLSCLLTLASCGVDHTDIYDVYNEPEPTIPRADKVTDEAGTELCFSAQYIRTDGYREGVDYPIVTIIRSVDELSAYYEANKDIYSLERRTGTIYSDSSIGFLDACDRYDEAYFEDRILLLVLLEEGSGSVRHTVESVVGNGDEIKIDITAVAPELCTDDMAEWHIFIEPETGAYVGDTDDITVYVNGKNATEKTTDVYYEKGYANIGLTLKEGWEYDVTDESDTKNFSVNIYPAGHKDNELRISYFEAFGVCGTELTFEEIKLGRYDAVAGTHVSNELWSFIKLRDTFGDYVIMNGGGAENWWSEYGDEAMDILATLKVADGYVSEKEAIQVAKDKADSTEEDPEVKFDKEKAVWHITLSGKNTNGDDTFVIDVHGNIVDIIEGDQSQNGGSNDVIYITAEEIDKLPARIEDAVFTADTVGGGVRLYYFDKGLELYRHNVADEKYYKCILELPETYTDGKIISMSRGAGSGEIEIILNAKSGEHTVYPGCIYYCGSNSDRQPLEWEMNNEAQLIERGILPSPTAQASNVSEAAVTDLAVRLFKESIEDGKNTLISPLSVLVALSMTANGADNETLAQMEAVLGMPIEQLNTWVKGYMSNLPKGENYKLSLANSTWFKDTDGFSVSKDFLYTATEYYNAGIFEAPFDASTLKQINEWVEKNTDGMIEDILDEIPPDAIMYLINALAFDAQWEKEYKEHNVRDGLFFTEDGERREVELMYSSENLYLEDEKATGFIKYYKDKKYAFAALLPNEGVTVSEYTAALDGEHLNGLLANAQHNTVSVAIPEFEVEYKVTMNEALMRMGMTDAFNGDVADFTRMGQSEDGNLYISRVIHQTYISVDDKGTKAGAATVVEMPKATSAMTEPPKTVFLDRPFVYMLIDCETNIPFFIGTMMDVED